MRAPQSATGHEGPGLWTAPGAPLTRLYRQAVNPRFLTLDQVAEELAVSRAQAYALVRSGQLPAVKLGCPGQGRG